MWLRIEVRAAALTVLVLLAVGLIACSAEVVAPTSTPVPTASATLAAPTPEISPVATIQATAIAGSLSPAARDYLDHALYFIQGNALYSSRVNWDLLWRDAYALAKGAQTPADTYPAIRLALRRLQDNHSFFLDPDQATAGNRGIATGKGFIIAMPGAVVALVYPRSPAALAGMRSGDIVETIDGVPTAGRPRDELYGAIASTPVSTLILRRGSELVTVELAASEFNSNPSPEGLPLAGQLGYISLPEFGGDYIRAEQYAAAVQDLIKLIDENPRCGWVVDLRRNLGGNMWPMLAGIGPILGEDKAGTAITRGLEQSWSYQAGSSIFAGQTMVSVLPSYQLKRPRPPVAVLTSQLTGSSGEIIAISFRGRPGTRSFGEATGGVPTGNISEKMRDGAVIYLTASVNADRTGQVYEDSIPPDQEVKIDWGAIGVDSDPVIAAARQWLEEQPACAP